MTPKRISELYTNVADALYRARCPRGHWEGQLSSSALSTATSVFALHSLDRSVGTETHGELINRGISWLVKHQNDDGGWGDTTDSPSNISTTTLCWAALGAIDSVDTSIAESSARAEGYLKPLMGELTASNLVSAITQVYGLDRTFSIPILTMCSLAGRLGIGRGAWRHVRQLPFELAALPHSLFHRLGLPVVSYALPALIAIGLVKHFHRPSWCPVTRGLRSLLSGRTMRKLERIQPENGGFLEAAPLTAFVLMSLAAIGQGKGKVAVKAACFLEESVREDGSWPIDTNLATWLTTLSVNALRAETLTDSEKDKLACWLIDQQYNVIHPYTQARPGGWAWTNLPGGVPDADDTAGALLALKTLIQAGVEETGRLKNSVNNGISWLLDLQNADRGIPTFCRGWGKLPFDRSTPDITAHAIRAWHLWRDDLPDELANRVDKGIEKAIAFLSASQRNDGSWVPLWFGNQAAKNQENPIHGTSRVLLACQVGKRYPNWQAAMEKATKWLVAIQNTDGGWGGDKSTPSTVEETSLAIEALATVRQATSVSVEDSIARGLAWLDKATNGGKQFHTSPIGLYFARLWYHEQLYPMIFTVAALRRLLNLSETHFSKESS